jgi:hypothetical protein
MEIIDKRHPDISTKQRKNNVPLITMSKSGAHFLFSTSAAVRFGLQAGKHLHFMISENKWLFWQDDDPFGFKLYYLNKTKATLCIHNAALVDKFKIKTRYTGENRLRFVLNATGTEKDGCPLIEIMTAKPYGELGK